MDMLEPLFYQDKSVKWIFATSLVWFPTTVQGNEVDIWFSKPLPFEKKRVFYKYGNSRCQVCNKTEEIDTFTSTVRGESLI